MHKNARLTPTGREVMLARLQAGQLKMSHLTTPSAAWHDFSSVFHPAPIAKS